MKPATDYTETELNTMGPKALVDIYNELAKITGAAETKRFATKADALKRVAKERAKAQTLIDNQKLFAEPETVAAPSGDVDPIPAPKPAKAAKKPTVAPKAKPAITATRAELVAATAKAVTAPKAEKPVKTTSAKGYLKPGRLAPTARKVEENTTTIAGLARSLIVMGLDNDAVLAAIRNAFAPKKIPNNAAVHYRADAKRRGMI